MVGFKIFSGINCNKIPKKGKIMNVRQNINKCIRQLVIPERIDWRESFAPCIKNNKAIPIFARYFSNVSQRPCAGKSVAKITAKIIKMTNRSSFILENNRIQVDCYIIPERQQARCQKKH